MMRSSAYFLIAFTLVLAACGRKPVESDLGVLYNRTAKAGSADRNPVIVIPGILGSRLIDRESGQVIWGVVGKDFANPKDPNEARKLALPLAEKTVPLQQSFDEMEPNGVLDTVKFELAGIVIELGAYVDILTALGAGGYTEEDEASIDYGDHVTCYQFAYDWRRDLVESAQKLDAFIRKKAEEVRAYNKRRFGVDKPVKFDIVAHSMGGLVARYYLRYGATDLDDLGDDPRPTWAGAQFVEKVVMVGTPNAGSVKSMKYLIEGRRFGPLLPEYSSSLLGTFPSLYQMMPRPRHRVMIDSETGRPIDFLDPLLWRRMGWGLADPDQEEMIRILAPREMSGSKSRQLALDHQAKILDRTRRFFKAIDKPAATPPGLSKVLVAGDGEPTAAIMTANLTDGSIEITEEQPGDGMVLRSSVLMDERLTGEWQPRLVSPIQFRGVLLLNSGHLAMTKDRTFTDNLLFYLLEAPADY